MRNINDWIIDISNLSLVPSLYRKMGIKLNMSFIKGDRANANNRMNVILLFIKISIEALKNESNGMNIRETFDLRIESVNSNGRVWKYKYQQGYDA